MKKTVLDIALDAAIEAGKEIMSVYESSDFETGIKYKDDNSPLTVADKRAHEKIIRLLETTGIPVLSEEGRKMDYSVRKEWKKLWIVDPLDGTKEFIKRNGEFTVNIALVKNGMPTLGIVYVPVKKIIYFSDGDSSFRAEVMDDKPVKPEKLPAIHNRAEFIIVASRSHLDPKTESYINEKKAEHGKVDTISCGSSIKICRVAEGSADEYPRFAPTMEWDTAAGHAVIIGAGKQIYNVETGGPLRYNKEELLNPFFIVK